MNLRSLTNFFLSCFGDTQFTHLNECEGEMHTYVGMEIKKIEILALDY